MKKTTTLDLYISAQNAALESIKETAGHAISTFALNRFNSEKLKPADWDYWHQIFSERRILYIALKDKPAASEGK